MKARTPDYNKYGAQFAVGCEPERPYSRIQIVLLKFLGLVLGRHIV